MTCIEYHRYRHQRRARGGRPAEIDITNAEGLRSALLNAAANRHGTLVADMTQAQFCDSSGLHTLTAAHKRARADDREVLLVIPGTAVLRIFAITGTDRVIPNFTSLDEALAAAAGLDDASGAEAELADKPCGSQQSR